MNYFKNTVILAEKISNWNCCFNCVFVHRRRDRYICHLKWYIKKYVDNDLILENEQLKETIRRYKKMRLNNICTECDCLLEAEAYKRGHRR